MVFGVDWNGEEHSKQLSDTFSRKWLHNFDLWYFFLLLYILPDVFFMQLKVWQKNFIGLLSLDISNFRMSVKDVTYNMREVGS